MILLGLLIIAYFIYTSHYSPINTTTKVSQIESIRKTESITHEFYYRPDCSDCQKLETRSFIKLLKTSNVTMINTKTLKKDANAQNWYKTNNITNVPTMVVSYNNKPVFIYSGTNETAYKRLLQNKDPKTNKTLDLNKTIYQNDFSNSREEINN